MIYQLYFLLLYGKLRLKIRWLWLIFLLVKLFFPGSFSKVSINEESVLLRKEPAVFFQVLYNQVRRQLHTQPLEYQMPTLQPAQFQNLRANKK